MSPVPPRPVARKPRADQSARATESMLASAERDFALVARDWLDAGLTHASIDQLLRAAFVDAAVAMLENTGKKPTISAVSLATGLHRREAKRLIDRSPQASVPVPVSMASALIDLWLTDRRYLDAKRRPRQLPRQQRARGASFEQLARSVSRDIHPRSQLDELARLGLVRIDGDTVALALERIDSSLRRKASPPL